MKRTVLLIAGLIIISFILLIYALNSKPTVDNENKISVSPIENKSTEITADTSIILSPEILTLNSDQTINLSVNIDSGANEITGVQLEIAYDKDVLSDIELIKGPFLPNATILFQEIDSETGRITYALVLPPSVSPVKGKGIVAQIRAKKNEKEFQKNQTTITILDKSLVSALGIEGSVLKSANSALVTFLSASPSGSINMSDKLSPTSNPAISH